MKSIIRNKAVCVLVAVLMVCTLILTGCGGSNGADSYITDEKSYDVAPSEQAERNSGFSGAEGDYAVNDAEISPDGNSAGYFVGNLPATVDPSRVKLIYTADIRVETMDFDQTMKDLTAMVEKYEGYFESSYTENGSYWSNENYIYGSFTVRIPSDKYQEFVSSVSDGMHVTQLSQDVQDIGQAYYEAESHLETLRNKHERLEVLLKQASSLSDIIELENALSQTEYEIEMYSNDLERYDSLLDYSTVNVTVETAYQYSPGLGEDRGFFQRVWESIKNGLAGFREGFTDFCEWIGYHLIQILIVIVLVVLFVKYGPHTRDKLRAAKGAKKNKKKAGGEIEVVRPEGSEEKAEVPETTEEK